MNVLLKSFTSLREALEKLSKTYSFRSSFTHRPIGTLNPAFRRLSIDRGNRDAIAFLKINFFLNERESFK
jgi:hypothetical protein